MTTTGTSGAPTDSLKVTIDLSPALQGHGGIGRYARELALAIAALPEETTRVCLSTFAVNAGSGRLAGALARLPGRTLPTRNRMWRARVALTGALGGDLDGLFDGIDVFHGTDHLLPPLRRVASVLTVHDLAFLHVPRTATALNRGYLRAMMPRFVRSADAIVADSESTRRDLLEAYGVEPHRVTTAHLGVGALYGPRSVADVAAVRARYGLPERYLLSVGTIEPRKNLVTLLRAFAAAALPEVGLALVGPRGWHLEAALGAAAHGSTRTLGDRVVQTGPVPEEDLPALYGGAVAFCFPSLFEGFGLPVLEAMACGAAVIASDVTSLPEVVGDAGVLLAPLDVDAWVFALRALASDPARCAELGARAQARAAAFTWQATAERTIQAYREAHARRA